VLADIQRFMDELAICDVPEPVGSSSSVFLFQQVPITRERLLKNKNWEAIAEHHKTAVFTMTDRTDSEIRALADLYADDIAGDIIEPPGSTACPVGDVVYEDI
jgi:hypothetical protein